MSDGSAHSMSSGVMPEPVSDPDALSLDPASFESSVQPNASTASQLYFDNQTDQLAYYNGSAFVTLTQQEEWCKVLAG
jgi:hypothetical protein